MLKKSLFLLLVLIGVSSTAQNYIMIGRIGSQEVTLAFVKQDTSIYDAKYYYNSNKAIINLEATVLDSTHITFTSMTANDDDTLAFFDLFFRDNDFNLFGIYQRNDKTVEEAIFSWFNILTLEHQFKGNELVESFKTEVPLWYVYTADLAFDQNLKELTFDKGRKVRIVQDKPTSTPSVRFINPTRGEKFIEAKVDSIALEQVISKLDCNPKYETSISIQRNDDLIFSFIYKVEFDCDGNGGDFYEQGYTFDKRDGSQITLTQLLNLANDRTDSDSSNLSAAFNNEKLIKNILKNTLINDGSSICDYDNLPLFFEKNFYLRDGGKISFIPYFDKPLAECRNTDLSTIKLSELAPFIAPNYLYLLD